WGVWGPVDPGPRTGVRKDPEALGPAAAAQNAGAVVGLEARRTPREQIRITDRHDPGIWGSSDGASRREQPPVGRPSAPRPRPRSPSGWDGGQASVGSWRRSGRGELLHAVRVLEAPLDDV